MKKMVIILIILIILFSVSLDCFASNSLDKSGIKIAVLSFENKEEVNAYDYLSKSIQNSIYEALNIQEGINLIPNKTSNEYSKEIGLGIQNRESLSAMMRFAAETTANVITIGEYIIHPDENIIDVNVYVYSIAQRDIIINISNSGELDNSYELLDMIAQKTSDKVKENRESIEIAIDDIIKDATPPKYTTKPQIQEISIEGIKIEWITTKETASNLILMTSKNKEDYVKKFGDLSEDAVHHYVIIPIKMLKKDKEFYFVVIDTDFIGNEIESSITQIKSKTVYNTLFNQYTEEKKSLLDQSIKKEESGELETALDKLQELQNLITKYDSYLNLSLDMDEISQRIELLKRKINKSQEMVENNKNEQETEIDTSDNEHHIENNQQNDTNTSNSEHSNAIPNNDDTESDADAETKTEDTLIRYETDIPLYYNETSSKRFKNDAMIELNKFTSGHYQTLAITNSVISIGSSATHLIAMISHINKIDILSVIPVGYDVIMGVSLSINSAFSTAHYVKYYRELKSIMTGIENGEMMFSQEYSNIRDIYGKLRSINKRYTLFNMIGGGVSTFLGVLLLIGRGDYRSTSYDNDGAIDSGEEYIISTLGRAGSYMFIHGISSFIYGGINIMLQPQMSVRPTMMMKDSASLFKRDLIKYGWALGKYTSDFVILNGFASPFGLITLFFLPSRSKNIKNTMTKISEGKIFYSEGYRRLRAYDKANRRMAVIESIIHLAVGAGAIPIISMVLYEPSYGDFMWSSIAGLLNIGAIALLSGVKHNIPHKDYYLESIREQEIPCLDKESDFSYIFKQDVYKSARMRHKNEFATIAIDVLSLYGVGLGYAHLLANNINPRMDLRVLDSILLITPFVAETTLMIFSITKRAKLNKALNSFRSSKTAFGELYPQLKEIYSDLSVLNLISGLSYTAFGVVGLIYSLVTPDFQSVYTDELRVAGFIMASSFMVPVGIYHLFKVGQKLPNSKDYFLENNEGIALNLTPYPIITTDGEWGLGLSLNLSW